MPKPNKIWELMQILDTAPEASLKKDLAFLVHCSKEELFNYISQINDKEEECNVGDNLDIIMRWCKNKGIADENTLFYIIKNVCTVLYFKQNPDIAIEDKQNIISELQLLYDSIENPSSFLQNEREAFLSAMATSGKVAGRLSGLIPFRFLVHGGLIVTPFIIMYLQKYLADEEMTQQDWTMAHRYGNLMLALGGTAMFTSYALNSIGFFNRQESAQNLYVVAPNESLPNDRPSMNQN